MSMLAVALVLAAQQAAPRRRGGPITETDLFRFVWIGDPQISPDGADVAFVRVAVNKKKDGYETALWIVPADGSAAAAARSRAARGTSAPRWSPDGRRLAFLRSAEKDGKPQPPQIHLMERAGGEARAITDLPKGASAPVWSPDGRTLAFTSTTNAKDLDARAKEGRADGEDERESDVRVITQRRLSLERRRLRRLRAAVPRVDGRRARRGRRRAVAAPGHQRRLRGGGAGLVGGRGADPVHLDPRRRAVLRGLRRGLVRGGRGGRRAGAGDEHRRVHRRRGAVAGRPAYRVPRHPQRQAAAVVHPAGPVRDGRRGRAAAEPDRGPRLRRDVAGWPATRGRRAAGEARPSSGRRTAAACSSSPPRGDAPT